MLLKSDLIVTKVNENLEISIKNTSDKIILQNYLTRNITELNAGYKN